MREALTSLLLSDAPLEVHFGDRMHWGMLPTTVKGYPCLTLHVIAAPESYHLDGATESKRTLVQADIWAESYGEAVAAERSLRNLLSGYRGTVAGILFRGIFIIGARDFSDLSAGDERRLFRQSVDMEIRWSAAT